MDWVSIINDLVAEGITQKEIGEAVGLRQNSISDMARGVVTKVSWDVGTKLLELHASKVRKSPQAEACPQ